MSFGKRTVGVKLDKSHVFIHRFKRTVATLLTACVAAASAFC